MPSAAEVLRVSTALSLQAAVLLALPVAWVLRALFPVLGGQRVSYWTGTPILTLGRKAASERRLGVRAVALVRYSYRISTDFDVDLTRLCHGYRILLYPLTWLAFMAMLASAKRIHTFADAGLLPAAHRRRVATAELLAYRLLRIRHFVWTYGADVRTRTETLALGEPNCCTDCTQVRVACICDSDLGQGNLARLRANGARIFSMGDMAEYAPGCRNDLFFWPIDVDTANPTTIGATDTTPGHGTPLRVVHAANHRQFKGTIYLEQAIAGLQQEGVPIELTLVEGMPNHQALEVYRSADVIFDQCMIGFHGYLALEAMALAKPVMCFIRKPDEYLIAPHECPIINTSVLTLRDDLRTLAKPSGRATLAELGRRGRHYVGTHYSYEAFAHRLARAYAELGVTP